MIENRLTLRLWMAALLLLALVAPWGVAPAGADERDEERRPQLEMRIFHVSALTAGKCWFRGEVAPPVTADAMSDEENPLFGLEGEEPFYPVGQVDELIELLKGGVDPAFWETVQGADVRSMGEGVIVARASKAVLDAIAHFLAKWETDTLRTVRVEVQAVRMNEEAALRAESKGIEALLTGPEAGPSLSFVAFASQRASAFNGREYAYVSDYDVSVAQEASASDPMVMVANLGLGVDATVTPSAGGRRMLVDLDIHLSEISDKRTVSTGEHRGVDAPAFAGTYVDGLVTVVPGAWTRAGGAQAPGWAFYVRVTPASGVLQSSTAAPLPALDAKGGTYKLRTFDVLDLCTSPRSRRSWERHIIPSRYTPPEPPELREPHPFVPAESLVELIRDAGGRTHWEDPCTIEARNGRMIVRNFPSVLNHTERVITALRDDFIRPITVVGEVVEMPASVAAFLAGPAQDAHAVSERAARLLLQAKDNGSARTVERVEMTCHDSARNAVSSGRHVTYLQDYETEIAQGAAIGNPVMLSLFAGLQLDVTAYRTSGGRAVGLDVRLMRTEQHKPLREADTPMGPIELPEMDVFRIRTGMVAPLGATVVVGMQGEGDRRRVLLLTPTVGR